MNNSYYSEQDDCDEMSGYQRAQRLAKIKHESLKHTAGIPLGKYAAIIGIGLLIWWACAGCSEYEVQSSRIDSRFELVVIDSCEYIYTPSAYLVHKANCNNKQHAIRYN